MMNLSIFKQPSAWLPIAFSLTGIAMVIGHVAIYGIVREPDERTPAHIFQLLMLLQVPIVGFFAAKWLPLSPKPAITVLLLQIAAALLAVGAVLMLT